MLDRSTSSKLWKLGSLRYTGVFRTLYAGHGLRVFVYGIVAFLEGILEAVALALLALIAVEITVGSDATVSIWWIESMSLATSLLIFLVLISVRLICGLWAAAVSSKVASDLSLAHRFALLDQYSASSFVQYSKLTGAQLQQMLATWPHQIGSLGSGILQQFAGILIVLSMFSIAFVGNSLLALSSVAFVGLFFVLLQPLRQRIRNLSRKVISAERITASNVDELANLQMEAQLFGVRKELRALVGSSLTGEVKARRRAAFAKASVSPIYTCLAFGTLGIFFVVVLNSSIEIRNSAPTLLIVLRALSYGQSIQHLGSSFESLIPLLEIVKSTQGDLEQNRVEAGDEKMGTFRDLTLVDVSAKYGEELVLRDVNMTIRAGDMIGIVGPSGGGKSSLLRVMAGILSPSSGMVLLSGKPIGLFAETELSKTVATVSQFPRVMADSMEQNVAFLRSWIDGDSVVESLRMAALEWSSSDRTELRQEAVRSGMASISGGQAQRMGLARAFAGRPSLMLLDEPTSSVDSIAQEAILQALQALSGDVSIVIVSHRLEVLRACSLIYVVEAGRVTDRGAWSDVVRTSQYLRELTGEA